MRASPALSRPCGLGPATTLAIDQDVVKASWRGPVDIADADVSPNPFAIDAESRNSSLETLDASAFFELLRGKTERGDCIPRCAHHPDRLRLGSANRERNNRFLRLPGMRTTVIGHFGCLGAPDPSESQMVEGWVSQMREMGCCVTYVHLGKADDLAFPRPRLREVTVRDTGQYFYQEIPELARGLAFTGMDEGRKMGLLPWEVSSSVFAFGTAAGFCAQLMWQFWKMAKTAAVVRHGLGQAFQYEPNYHNFLELYAVCGEDMDVLYEKIGAQVLRQWSQAVGERLGGAPLHALTAWLKQRLRWTPECVAHFQDAYEEEQRGEGHRTDIVPMALGRALLLTQRKGVPPEGKYGVGTFNRLVWAAMRSDMVSEQEPYVFWRDIQLALLGNNIWSHPRQGSMQHVQRFPAFAGRANYPRLIPAAWVYPQSNEVRDWLESLEVTEGTSVAHPDTETDLGELLKKFGRTIAGGVSAVAGLLRGRGKKNPKP